MKPSRSQNRQRVGPVFLNESLKRKRTVMLKRFITTALICSSSLITSACRTADARAVLVGRFAEEELMVATIVIPQPEGGEYQMYIPLRQDQELCVLTGIIPEDDFPFFGRCENLSGTGSISCNNGRSRQVRWLLTSCQSGHGRSIGSFSPDFFFGFSSDKEKAIEQLKWAEPVH